MNLEKYNKLIRNVGKQLIEHYIENKCVLCGINGPYDDPETGVRNLSHLIIITSVEVLKFEEIDYKRVLYNMGQDLLRMKALDGLYCMREKRGKDKCNGVIGHAWVIEALIYLWKVFKEDVYLQEAIEIAKRHLFNEKLGLWGRPNMTCTDETIDFTLNHQIWYAASIGELLQFVEDEQLKKEFNCFMSRLDKNMEISKYGKISHSIYNRLNILNRIKYLIKKYVYVFRELLNKASFAYKEEGYHVFNIMALARIYKIVPGSDFYKGKKFKKSIYYINKGHLYEGLLSTKVNLDYSLHNSISDVDEKDINIYGYPYNVPGFELMYSNIVFAEFIEKDICAKVLSKQFELTYDEKRRMFGKKCHDKNTINYRVYEYYRFLEIAR